MKRISITILVCALLILCTVTILTFTHSYAILEDGKRCAASLATSQWPKWIGCAMAAHENLAGGLIAAAGALIAAWVAYAQVQRQMENQRQQRRIEQIEAKETAVLAITQPVHAAAVAMTMAATQINTGTHSATELVAYDTIVKHVDTALNASMIQRIVPDLEINDRLLVVSIISTLRTFVAVATQPNPALSRNQKLAANRETLIKLGRYLQAFDTELANVYFRDASPNGLLPAPDNEKA